MSYRSDYHHWVQTVRQLVAKRDVRVQGLRGLAQGELLKDQRAGMYRGLNDAQIQRVLDAKYQEFVDKDIEVRGISAEIRDAQQAAIMYGFGALMEQTTPVHIPAPR